MIGIGAKVGRRPRVCRVLDGRGHENSARFAIGDLQIRSSKPTLFIEDLSHALIDSQSFSGAARPNLG
jgi:hypothetical protein